MGENFQMISYYLNSNNNALDGTLEITLLI